MSEERWSGRDERGSVSAGRRLHARSRYSHAMLPGRWRIQRDAAQRVRKRRATHIMNAFVTGGASRRSMAGGALPSGQMQDPLTGKRHRPKARARRPCPCPGALQPRSQRRALCIQCTVSIGLGRLPESSLSAAGLWQSARARRARHGGEGEASLSILDTTAAIYRIQHGKEGSSSILITVTSVQQGQGTRSNSSSGSGPGGNRLGGSRWDNGGRSRRVRADDGAARDQRQQVGAGRAQDGVRRCSQAGGWASARARIRSPAQA